MSYTNGLDKPSSYFNTVLYTGNGTTNAITGVGFQPDFVWTKSRSAVYDHFLTDVILRTSNKYLRCNTTNAEQTGVFSSLDSDGFTISGNSGNNTSSATEVSWNWKAGGTGVSNTQGSIASTVSANTTSGFSIVSYTGTGANATVGHGLGVAPKVVIVKDRTSANNWRCYFSVLGNTSVIQLNTTDASGTSTSCWNSSSPTVNIFNLGTNPTTNGNTNNFIAYCFADVKGFSKFGSYTGNGSADGTFVYTGFKPAFVMTKSATQAYRWYMFDNKRNIYNVVDGRIFANDSSAEQTNQDTLDFISNGFKIRTGDAEINGSGQTIIYMAFAENPLVTSTGIPTTAR